MDRRAAFERSHVGVERIERLELQDVLRVDRVRIAQPGFDFRDGQRARPVGDGRLRRGPRFGLVDVRLFQQPRVSQIDFAAVDRLSSNPADNWLRRCSQREATVGAPSAFSARVR